MEVSRTRSRLALTYAAVDAWVNLPAVLWAALIHVDAVLLGVERSELRARETERVPRIRQGWRFVHEPAPSVMDVVERAGCRCRKRVAGVVTAAQIRRESDFLDRLHWVELGVSRVTAIRRPPSGHHHVVTDVDLLGDGTRDEQIIERLRGLPRRRERGGHCR